jgi:hypothetical protein
VKATFLVENRGLLPVINERILVRTGCCLVTACDGEHALGLVRDGVPALLPLDMFAPNVDRTAGSSIDQDNPTDRPISHHCAHQPFPEQRASIEKGRHHSLPRQLETRTAPTFRIPDSDREPNMELTSRGKRRCRTPKPRLFHAAGENEI